MVTLTEAQLRAIESYTAGGYLEINGELRGDAVSDPAVFTHIHNLEAAISAASIPKQITVYRGVDQVYAEYLERQGVVEGDIIVDKGFLSTSRRAERARPFSRHAGGLLFKIRVPAGAKGLDVAPYSANPDECEIVLQKDTQLRVIGYEDEYGILELEVVCDE